MICPCARCGRAVGRDAAPIAVPPQWQPGPAAYAASAPALSC